MQLLHTSLDIPSGLVFCSKKAGHKSHKFYLHSVYQRGKSFHSEFYIKYVQADLVD